MYADYRAAVLAPALLTLASCVSVVQPVNDATVSTASVDAEISFATRVCGDFRVRLDGQDVTAAFNPQPPSSTNPRATFTELTAGRHTLHAWAEVYQFWFLLIPICSGASDSVTFDAVPPSLGFSPSGPITLADGDSRSVRVTLNPRRTVQTDVALSSSTGSVASISPQSATIPAGQTTSGTALIEALAPGEATIRATASGTSPASLQVTVPQPDFAVSVSPQDATVPWGATASYMVSVSSQNDFSGTVQLSVADAPEGSSPTISPPSVSLAPGATAQATLHIATTEAATELGTTEFEVTGSGAGLSRRDDATVKITRVSGSFGAEAFPLRITSATCGVDVEAEVTASGSGPVVVFTTPLGTASSQIAGGYDFSSGSKCRGGLVLPPVVTRPSVVFYNFKFPPLTGADGIGSPQSVEFPVVGTRFSPDDSIAVVYGDSGSGSPRDFAIFAVDLVEGRFSGTSFFDGGVSSVSLDAEAGEIVVVPIGGTSFEISLPWL